MDKLRPDAGETRRLLDCIQGGDMAAREQLLRLHREDLKKFVDFHLDARLRSRFDPSDIVQETQMELLRRLDDYLASRPMPFHVWQRKKAYERLLNLRRDHVQRQRRSVMREAQWPERSSLLLAAPLLDRRPSPSDAIQAKERVERVRRAVERLGTNDREILLMRHAEDLPFEEIACLIGASAAAARKRFGRALIRLQKLLSEEGLLGAHDDE